MQKQIVRYPMTGGIDVTTDPKHVQPPDLLRCENLVHDTPGRLTQMPGSSVIGSQYTEVSSSGSRSASNISTLSQRALYADDQRLFLGSYEKLLGYDQQLDKWMFRGLMPIVHANIRDPDVRRKDTSLGAPVHGDYAIGAGGALEGVVGGEDGTLIWASITERRAGNQYFFSLSGANVSNIRIVGLSTGLYVFYADGAAPRSLKMVSFTTSNLPTRATDALSSAAVTVIANDLLNYAGSGGKARFEVQAKSDGNSSTKTLCAYVTNASTIKYGYVLNDGSLEAAFNTETPATAPSNIALAIDDSTGKFAILWSTTTPKVVARLFNSDGTTIISATDIETAPAEVTELGGVWISSTKVHVVWNCDNTNERRVRHGSIDTSAVVTAANLFFNAMIISYPWAFQGTAYVAIGTYRFNHGQYLMPLCGAVVRLGPPGTTGVTYPGSSGVGCVVATYLAGDHVPAPFNGLKCRISHVWDADAAGLWRYAVMRGLGPNNDSGVVTRTVQTSVAEMDMTVLQPAACQRVGGGTFFPGGILWRVDSEAVVEAGFLQQYPLVISVAKTNEVAGGLTASSVYAYRVYFEWYTASGEREQSSAVEFSTTTGATDDTVTLTIATCPITNKTSRLGFRNLGFAVYRKNPGATAFRRVCGKGPDGISGSNGYVLNDQTAETVTFKDSLADANAVLNEEDYLSSTPQEIDNIAPTAHKFLAYGQGRVFVSGFAENPDLVNYSKQRGTGEALAFHDANQIVVPGGHGAITAIACLSEAVIIFRKRQIYVVNGDGPNNLGSEGGYSPPRLIANDLGTEQHNSVVRGPLGVYFLSDRGVYLIGNDLSLSFVGAKMSGDAGFGSVTDPKIVYAAVSMQLVEQIRWVCEQETYVLNYGAGNSWSRFVPPFTAKGAATWGAGSPAWTGMVWLTDAGVLRESGLVYQLGGVSQPWALETAWFKPDQGLQQHGRIQRILLAGTLESPNHLPTVEIRYNYDETLVETLDLVPSSDDYYQLEIRPSRQRVQSIKLTIYPSADGVHTYQNAFSLSEIALEIASYGTLARPASTKRVT